VHKQVTSPVDILRAYGKVAIKAHEKTNCVTEILFPEAEEWAKHEINLKGPLAGIPVSLKDSLQVKGFDISVGYSKNVGKPYAEDGAMVKLLKQAGAVPFVKTNLPTTLLSFESTNDVWGQCTNPHNIKYSPSAAVASASAQMWRAQYAHQHTSPAATPFAAQPAAGPKSA
jgi:Asp-tRNA(Asn)/Glu-tRNA(Gln) amidotransferase A subunit family amidase